MFVFSLLFVDKALPKYKNNLRVTVGLWGCVLHWWYLVPSLWWWWPASTSWSFKPIIQRKKQLEIVARKNIFGL